MRGGKAKLRDLQTSPRPPEIFSSHPAGTGILGVVQAQVLSWGSENSIAQLGAL